MVPWYSSITWYGNMAIWQYCHMAISIFLYFFFLPYSSTTNGTHHTTMVAYQYHWLVPWQLSMAIAFALPQHPAAHSPRCDNDGPTCIMALGPRLSGFRTDVRCRAAGLPGLLPPIVVVLA
jgi:hypothetical protein